MSAKVRYALLIVLFSLVVRLIPAALIYGSDDMTSWKIVAQTLAIHGNPYEMGVLNWPPLWPLLILYCSKLSLAYGLPLPFCLKLFPIVADMGLALVIYGWSLRRSDAPSAAYRRALWYALNPVAIYTSAFHGQFDSIPTLFAVMAVIAAEQAASKKHSLTAAFWLGMGGFAKTWPLMLLPVLIRNARPMRKQVVMAVISISPAFLSIGALYLNAPDTIMRNVILYRGSPGWWGLTTPISVLSHGAAERMVQAIWILFYAVMIFVYIWACRDAQVIRNACLIILTFYIFTPGFATQYLVWIVPFALLADERHARIYTVLTGLTLTFEYIFRPFNGTYGQFLAAPLDKTPVYIAAYGHTHDKLLSCADRAPLWLFCIWWWLTLLREKRNRVEPFAACVS